MHVYKLKIILAILYSLQKFYHWDKNAVLYWLFQAMAPTLSALTGILIKVS